MKEIGTRVIAVAATFIVIGIAAVSVLQLFGGLFFGYSLWYYIPPICTLAVLPALTIDRRGHRLLAVYSLVGLFIMSYVLRNWRDVEIAARDSIWLVIVPHALQSILCLSVLCLAHRRT